MRTTALLVSGLLATGAVACETNSCFVAGTLVSTPDGKRPIESLRPGDEVLAYSVEQQLPVVRRVAAVHRSSALETRRLHIRAADAEASPSESTTAIEVTPSHPVWLPERRSFVAAGELVSGDVLAVLGGRELRPAVVAAVDATNRRVEGIEVFNLTVEGPESTYFAGGVLVHNKELVFENCEPLGRTPVAPATLVRDEGNAGGRYVVDVTLPNETALHVRAQSRDPGRPDVRTDVADIRVLDKGDHRNWTVEFVVPRGHVVSLLLTGTATRPDTTTCSMVESFDVVTPS